MQKKNKIEIILSAGMHGVNNLSASTYIRTNKYPQWWKDLPTNSTFDAMSKTMNGKQFFSAKTCPSFVDVLSNSYSIVSPCDWMLKIREDLNELNITEPFRNLYSIEGAISIVGGHSFNQLGNILENYVNIKVAIPLFMRTTKKRYKLMYMDPLYHESNLPFTIMPGALDLIPSYTMPITINYYISKQWLFDNIGKEILIKEGTVISQLYAPQGKIKINEVLNKEGWGLHPQSRGAKKFVGNYLSLLKNWKNK